MTDMKTKPKQRKYFLLIMNFKNILLAFILQLPLAFVLVVGVHCLTGISLLWCVPIAFVLDMMCYFGESIRRGK
jgi:hypothetical protein